ncbi:hypothetical protein, partial [Geobacillus stearothermophilus]|uniref:hypothetical protein n=1 Tax=Geobacillus stearothermophilus TaxID=1422 RepID=UPI001E2BE550
PFITLPLFPFRKVARFLRPPFPPLGRPAAIEEILFIVNVCTDGKKSHFPLFLAISHAVLTRLEYNDTTIYGHAHKYRCRPPAARGRMA